MRVVYICDGAGVLGWGHVGRARAIAEHAGESVTVVVGSGHQVVGSWSERLALGLRVVPWSTATIPFSPANTAYDVAIVDHYTLSPSWIDELRSEMPVVLIDDWMRSDAPVDVLVNPNIGASPSDYASGAYEVRFGPSYAMLRREIRAARPSVGRRRSRGRVLLTFGGSDPDGRTAIAIDALVRSDWYRRGGSITVVLGPSYTGPEPWKSWERAQLERLQIVRQPEDFVERCIEADLVVCGAGTTTYELAYLGRPFLPIALVDNQARVAAEWAERLELSRIAVWDSAWIPCLVDSVESVMSDASRQSRMGEYGATLVDGRGVERVLEITAALCDGERPGEASGPNVGSAMPSARLPREV